MLTLNLNAIFKARGITYPNSFLVKNGISRNVATSLISGRTRNIKLDHIEKLCRALNCEPSDLFRFESRPDDFIPKDHPLLNLQNNEEPHDLRASLSNLPYKQLLEFTKNIPASKEE